MLERPDFMHSRLLHAPRPPRRRGAMLLEVVIALSILLLAMSVVGLAFHNVQDGIERAERISQAAVMTERLVAEMDTGFLDLKDQREVTGWFGIESIPGMSWRVEVNPHERIERLVEVDIHIYMGDPDGPEEEREWISSTRVWRPEPGGLDLEKDFGLDEEQIDLLMEAIPGGVAMVDPTDFDPRALAQLDMEMLIELLPTLIQTLGASFLTGGQMDGLLEAVEQGDLGALQDMAQQGLGPPGRGGLPGGPPGDARGGGDRGGQGGGTRQGLGQRRGGGG